MRKGRLADSPDILLCLCLSLLPRMQFRSKPVERFVVYVEDARVTGAPAAVFAVGAYGRHGPWIDILLRHRKLSMFVTTSERRDAAPPS